MRLSANMQLSVVPAGNIESYLQAARSIPMLTVEEERDLATRLQKEGDLEAAQQLVLSHLRFVAHIARGYSGYGLAQADLIQEGNIGLMKAVKRFDPEVGVRLVSFAVYWIRAEMHEFILRNWRIVKVATTKAQRKLFFNLRSHKNRLGWFNQEEVNTVAEELGVSAKDVREMESRMSGHDMAFDEPDDDDERTTTTVSPVAYLQDLSEEPAQLVEAQDEQEYETTRLTQAISELDERSRDIIQQRWLAEDKATLHNLAAKYSVSAERIRQLESNAIKKMKLAMS